MRALGAHIRKHADKFPREFVLHVQMPLLDIGPLGLGGNGNEAEWEERAGTAAQAGISNDVVLHWRQSQRRRVFQRFRIGFVAVGVLPKDAVAATDGRFPIAKRIPGEAYAWRRIPQVTFHATI